MRITKNPKIKACDRGKLLSHVFLLLIALPFLLNTISVTSRRWVFNNRLSSMHQSTTRPKTAKPLALTCAQLSIGNPL